MMTPSNFLVPGPKVSARYGITGRTLNRWKCDPNLDFPQPITINHRDYYDERALEVWERQRAAASRNMAKRPPNAEPHQHGA